MARPAPPALAFQDDAALLTPGPVRDRLLDQMRRQGAKDIRTNVVYGRVKEQGLGAYDDLVNAARARGMHVQMTLMGTPRYSPQMDQGLSYQHANPAVMQQFAGDVARHFRGRVGRYSVWNEPNHEAFIAGALAHPTAAGRTYRSLYRAGYAGIKKADPGAQVMLGEIASQQGADKFLAAVLAGKPLKTSGLAYHPYQTGQRWDINSLDDLQATLARYKRQGKLQTATGKAAPLYLTEFGYQKGSMSDQDRMRLLAAGYAKARAAGARQLLQYQLMPTVPKTTTVPGDPVTDSYGGVAGWGPARAQQAGGFLWDTGIADASGRIPVINRAAKLPAVRSGKLNYKPRKKKR